MTNLTPERRAELRGLAESAQPFIRHGGTDPAAVYVPAAELTALLDAADEADRLQDVERRLAVLLCNLTGGKLSKTDYPVELMEQEIEEYLAGHHESDLRDERFLRDAHRVSDAYNTVARRVYRAAMKRRKTVRIADLLDGQPMVWPDGDE